MWAFTFSTFPLFHSPVVAYYPHSSTNAAEKNYSDIDPPIWFIVERAQLVADACNDANGFYISNYNGQAFDTDKWNVIIKGTSPDFSSNTHLLMINTTGDYNSNC